MIQMAVFVVCILFAVLSDSTAIENREDDIGLQSLVTLVQQQAATILKLEARVAALENRDNAQTMNLSVLTTGLNKINDKIGKQVAFSAHMSGGPISVGTTSPFIFDAITTNMGNSYNGHTGIFLAPYDGIYVFYFMMINHHNAPTIHAAIEKDGTILGMGTSDSVGNNNLWDDGSVLVTTHLTKGDQVYVRRVNGGSAVEGGWFTNFSGFLLSADN